MAQNQEKESKIAEEAEAADEAETADEVEQAESAEVAEVEAPAENGETAEEVSASAIKAATGKGSMLYKLTRFAFISAIIGVCTIGICPAFGIIGIVVPLVIQARLKGCDEALKSEGRKAIIAGVVSLFMFLIDIIIAILVVNHMG